MTNSRAQSLEETRSPLNWPLLVGTLLFALFCLHWAHWSSIAWMMGDGDSNLLKTFFYVMLAKAPIMVGGLKISQKWYQQGLSKDPIGLENSQKYPGLMRGLIALTLIYVLAAPFSYEIVLLAGYPIQEISLKESSALFMRMFFQGSWRFLF